MKRIAKRRLICARASAAGHGIILVGTIAAFVPALEYVFARAVNSGFSQYLSLVATDSISLYGSWKSLVLSLVESAPILGGITVLLILFIFAYSARKMAADIGRLRMTGSFEPITP